MDVFKPTMACSFSFNWITAELQSPQHKEKDCEGWRSERCREKDRATKGGGRRRAQPSGMNASKA